MNPAATDRKNRLDDEHIMAEQKQELQESERNAEEMIPRGDENPELTRLREAKKNKKHG